MVVHNACAENSPTLVWFREDLRLSDNAALADAVAAGGPVALLFVLDEVSPGLRALGGASRWWLSRSLSALSADLTTLGARLILRRGPAGQIVPAIAAETGAARVVWNRRHDGPGRAIDTDLKSRLRAAGLEVNSFRAATLRDPWAVTTKTGEPMKVFTPFWRAHRALGSPPATIPRPDMIRNCSVSVASDRLDDWALEPKSPNWAVGFEGVWQPGEAGARDKLAAFIDGGIHGYADDRDRPDLPATSRLSPHLRFGEISAATVFQAVETARELGAVGARDADKFLAEMGWREFSHNLLFHWSDLRAVNFNRRFDAFPWRSDPRALAAWQRGATGYPIVDAGMRELWSTGWMHNRVRMIAASFLIKHLLIDWREGEAWFWDTLVDAEEANNAAGWQWVAGSGADAAPYFRIFNPIAQGAKFDPDGDYVRRHVPELARVPTEWIHAPWEAPASILSRAGVTLGVTYPPPIVDHQAARARALSAFQSLSASSAALSLQERTP